MAQDSALQIARRKSLELSYILLRVASGVKNIFYKQKLEAHALNLLELGSEPSVDLFAETKVLERLLILGGEAGFIHKGSSEVLISEIRKINSAITDLFKNREGLPDLSLPDSFNKDIKARGLTKEKDNSANIGNLNRQNSILSVIRQFGNCKLRDILENFPDTSERTLRYDLQRLVEEGKVERIGNGGPATFYRENGQVSTLDPASPKNPILLSGKNQDLP